MLGYIDIADTSSSDPGQAGSLSPYCDMKSLYFDDSFYENKEHYRISQYLEQWWEYTLERENENEWEEIVFVAKDEEEYNSILDSLYRSKIDKIKMYGTSINPLEIIVAKDPREKYRKFDEGLLMTSNTNEEAN